MKQRTVPVICCKVGQEVLGKRGYPEGTGYPANASETALGYGPFLQILLINRK